MWYWEREAMLAGSIAEWAMLRTWRTTSVRACDNLL